MDTVPTTVKATGNVDKPLTGVSESPIMPPTNTIKTLGDIKSARLSDNIQTFFGSWSIKRKNCWLRCDYKPFWINK